MALKVARYDDDLFVNGSALGYFGDNKTAYANNMSNYASINFKPKLDPANAWATPFVTGHKYLFQFGEKGVIDFTEMTFRMSENWKQDDKAIHLVHRFVETREAVDVRVGGAWGT